MFHGLTRRICTGVLKLSLLFTVSLASRGGAQTLESLPAAAADASPITNLLQLTRVVDSEGSVFRDVQLEVVVCAASRPKVGVLIARDETGAELLELGDFGQEIFPGEKIRIQHWYCHLRKRDPGVEISTASTIDNDGIHLVPTSRNREITLPAGLIPLRLDWFNCLHDSALEVSCESSNGSWQKIPNSALWHSAAAASPGSTNLLPGLHAECYEGCWETLPDFSLLRPVKTGVTANFDLPFKTRDELVGIRFTGYFNAPYDGKYTFRLLSDDGSVLFLRDPIVPIKEIGRTAVPAAKPGVLGEAMDSLDQHDWLTVEGNVDFIAKSGEGLELELRSEPDSVWVKVADASGVDPSSLLNSDVRITGVSHGAINVDKRMVFGRLMVASAREITVVESDSSKGKLPSPLTTARQVQSLPIEDAKHELPVRIHGVVTSANIEYDHWMSIQDNTRGIWINLHGISNSVPACGEVWEVTGHSGSGDFAPVVIADRVTFLGVGRMPEPVRPTWNELINGSMDVQWAEFQGLVTDVQSNNLALSLPEGHLTAQMEGYRESDLKPFLKAGVRIRGTLYAVWDASTREVRVGNILMRNATIDVDQTAPDNPFDALVKKPRELFLFDAQATPFQRIKVQGEVIHAESSRIFLMQGGVGMRIIPTEEVNLQAGDRIEAVGYPEISGPSPVLHEAVVRKIGESALPSAREIADSELTAEGLDSSLVRIAGKLVGVHSEQNTVVLEMQAKTHLFLARLSSHFPVSSLRIGSQLALTGVYTGQTRDRQSDSRAGSFELLLNSPADIVVLAKPSWWTLERLLTVVGVLLVVLILAAVWITQLQRQVTQRTLQLQREIRERERVERQHALEAERARIARDLHDDLGSSLTEISVLASTGRHSSGEPTNHPGLFHAIADKAHGLISALDVIVWAVDPEDNSLQSLADYLNGFVGEYLSNSGISCRFKIPVSVPAVILEGRVRHDLFLAVKETLNNIVRHARASEVEFRIVVAENVLEIIILDNGTGFELAGAKNGHGLENLSARLTKLGGSYTVNSNVGAGTTVNIRLPLPGKLAQE
jgi:signal transduction histidine kinase